MADRSMLFHVAPSAEASCVNARIGSRLLECLGGAILPSSSVPGIAHTTQSARSPLPVAPPRSFDSVSRALTQPASARLARIILSIQTVVDVGPCDARFSGAQQ